MSKATIYISGIIGVQTTLTDVIRQFKSFENPAEVEYELDTNGGSIDEGKSIYNYLQGLELPLTAVIKKAYSIGSHIAMASEKRIVEEGPGRFMLHMPLVSNLTGNSEKLDFVSSELKKIEKEFISFYSEHLPDLPKETISDLLKNETFISGEEALAMGLATEVRTEIKAVAFYDEKNQEKKSNTIMSLTTKLAKKLVALLEEKPETKPKVEAVMLQDASGNDIDFPDTEEGVDPQIGERINDSEGNPITGETVMPDGKVYISESGSITEVRTEEDQTDQDTEPEAVAEVIKEVMKWSTEVNESSFEQGTQLTYTYDGTTYNMGAGEFELEDGRRIVTDADGKVVEVKQDLEEPTAEDAEANKELEKEKEAEVLASVIYEALNKQNIELKSELLAVKKLIGTEDVDLVSQQKTKPWEEMTALEKRRATKNL